MFICKVSRFIRFCLVRVLLSVLPLVKPYGDYSSSIGMIKALIDYYLCLSYRAFIWYVVDLYSKQVVDVHLSLDGRTSIDVLRIVGKLGFNAEYVHDGGPWYKSLE